MLKVRKLRENAILPTVAHPGEDLGYDLYSCEEVVIPPRTKVRVSTGIAVEISHFCPFAYAQVGRLIGVPAGGLVRDRSSMASKGIIVTGGVIDAGYRGEVLVLLTNLNNNDVYKILPGDKIAQLVPVPVYTGEIIEVAELTESARDSKGFGSSGT